jgi:PHD/YefM family antitoxin component YafN of YafNO toxin-antitoxin module
MVNIVPQIRPVSDLKNNYREIAAALKENARPIFLTKNGHGEMVLMSMDGYAELMARVDIELKLKEAEVEAARTDVRYSHGDVMSAMRKKVKDIEDGV